jgi:U3 small nucleolar RNA-associated protein 10
MTLLTAERIPQTFRFVLPYHSSLTSPPTHAVIYAAAHNFAFFAAFNQQILRICQESAHSPAIISFWSSIASQAIDTMLTEAQSGISSVRSDKLEAVLLRILPVINDALAIRQVTEVTVCACLLITVLAAKGHLSDNIIQTLMEAVISSWSSATADARLVCLSVLAQNSQLKKLPKTVSKKVLALPDILDRLRIISDAYDIDPLLVALINRSIEKFIRHGDGQTLILIKGVLDPNFSSKQVRYSIAKKLTSESASFLSSEGEYSAQEREQTRQNLAALFEVISVSQANALIASVAHKKGLDLAKLGAVLGIPIWESVEDSVEEITFKTAEHKIHESKPLSSFNISDSTQNDTTPRFLEQFVSTSFIELSNIFCAISSSSSDLTEFLDYPALQSSKAKTDDATLISFLLRISSSNLPIRPRTIALDHITDLISNATKGNTDYHILTPYIVRMLADPNVNIRRSASKCLLAVNKAFEGAVLPQTWAKTSFYANVTGTVALSSSDAKIFLKTVLLPRLEECILDQSVILKTLRTALSKKSSDQSGLSSLSSSSKLSIINFLATHSTKTKLLSVRLTLFSVLASIGKAGSEIRSTIILPTILEWSKMSTDAVEQACQNQGFDLSIVNQSHFQCIVARDESTASTFGDLIQDKGYRPDAVASAYSRLEQLWQTIEREPRLELISRIFTLATSHNVENGSVQQAQKCIRSLQLLTEDLELLITSLPKAVKMPEGPVAKRRRVSKTESLKFESAPQVTLDALQAYTLVLEVVDQSTPSQHPSLLKSLFDILAELQSFALQTNTNLEYLKYLTVNSLLQIVDNLKVSSPL